jgi:hypothetical protein
MGLVRPTFRTSPPSCRLIAVTGGLLSGKAELLRALRERFSSQLIVVPDRKNQDVGLRQIVAAEQRALDDGRYRLALCPHTTIDAMQRSPGAEELFWREIGTSRKEQYARYDAVIHLRPPPLNRGGTRAMVVAQRAIEEAWGGHPRRNVIDWRDDCGQRLAVLMAQVERYLPTLVTGPPRAAARPVARDPLAPGEVKRMSAPLIRLERAARFRARLMVRYGPERPLVRAGTSLNISRGGFALHCESPLVRGETVLFAIEDPRGDLCRGTGAVVWTRLQQEEASSVMGIRLLRVHESYLHLLGAASRPAEVALG